MKNIKFAVLFTALISMLSLSSCLNDSNGDDDSYDIYGLGLTLKTSTYGGYYLVSDEGLVFNPTDATVLSGLTLTTGGYLQRFYGAVKLVDGEKFSSDKKTYNITKLALQAQIVYNPMTTQSDTISGDYGIADIEGSIWAVNGYLNIPIKFYSAGEGSVAPYHFNAYATDAKEDTLFVTLQQSRKIGTDEKIFKLSNFKSSINIPYSSVFSFSMPFSDSKFTNYYNQLDHSNNDTIVIKLTAKVYNKVTPLVKTTKYKCSQR